MYLELPSSLREHIWIVAGVAGFLALRYWEEYIIFEWLILFFYFFIFKYKINWRLNILFLFEGKKSNPKIREKINIFNKKKKK